jgi:hypothetical protein
MVEKMANEALTQAVKKIIGLARAGSLDEAYAGYRDLFADPTFLTYSPQDQRQALKLMIFAKGVPDKPTPKMVEAHRSALAPLTELVSSHGEPADHEMLGMCHVMLGHEESASIIYRAGLAIERQRNAQSDLCGQLMKRISLL